VRALPKSGSTLLPSNTGLYFDNALAVALYLTPKESNPTRVDRPVTKHLSTQSRPDPRGGLCCLWCPNKTSTLLLVHLTLTIIENGLEMRKLWPPKVKGGQELKKQTTKHYKGWFLNTQKNSLYVALLLLKFKDDL